MGAFVLVLALIQDLLTTQIKEAFPMFCSVDGDYATRVTTLALQDSKAKQGNVINANNIKSNVADNLRINSFAEKGATK